MERNVPSVMAIGMYSADGEYVKWYYAVHCTGAVENWFKNIGKYLELIKPQFKLQFFFNNRICNAIYTSVRI